MYNWDSILSFGKYKLTRLRRIPASYFLGIRGDKIVQAKDQPLIDFINAHLEEIKALGSKTKEEGAPEIDYGVFCQKYRYSSEEEAKKHIKEIARKSDDREYNKHKIPNRAYQCEICGFWHLTSKSDKYAAT